MDDEQEWWPSRDLQPAISKAITEAIEESFDWEAVDTMATPVYAYITELLNHAGGRSFLVSNAESEITLGIAVWDENGDDILASQQVPLSEIILSNAYEDLYEMEQARDGLAKSLAIIEAKIAEHPDAPAAIGRE